MIFNRSADTPTSEPAAEPESPAETAAVATADAAPEAADEPAPEATAPAEPAHAYGGWVRVDSDNVLRGWVTDRKNRADRPMVEVLIDEEPIALRPADRFDQKLQDLGEADGRYAFAVVIPEAYRDGLPHTFEARVQGDVFRLKSKRTDFTIEPEASLPEIEVVHQGLGQVAGRLTGGQFSRPPPLELWGAGRRLEDRVVTEWTGSGASVAFVADYPLDLLQGLEADAPLVIAAAGMIEGGLPGGALQLDVAARGAITDEGVLRVETEGLDGLDQPVLLQVLSAQGEVLVEETLALDEGAGSIMLAPEARPEGFHVALSVGGWAPAALAFTPLQMVGNLVANASFQVWRGEGPAEWAPGPEVAALVRGYHPFPARVSEQQGVSGDFVHLELGPMAAGESRVLLSQPLVRALPTGQPVVSALMARASERATLRLRLIDGEGAEQAGIDLPARRPWTWEFATDLLQVAAGGEGLTLEVLASAEAASDQLMVEIAGARIGGDRFSSEEPAAPEEPAPSDNAVVNADLADWPSGVVIRGATGRAELARGWFAFNRRSSSPVMARAVFEADEPDTVGIAVAAPVVPDYCRLEIQLDAAALDGLTEGMVSFEAGATQAARGLLAASAVSAPEFLLIDRVMVLRRRPAVTERGFQLLDETVATLGRRLLVTRTLHRFDLPLAATGAAAGSDYAWEQGAETAEGEAAEYFLVLEFRQPFAVSLRNMALTRTAPAAPEEAPYLALEDRSIAAQAKHIKGLSAWISPYVATPLSVLDAAPPRPVLRWRWSRAGMGSVEVVVCVYNAIEETLDCLRSLIASSQVPHTVRIINDASEPIVGQRLDAFVADKPWMAVIHHEENQGYTTSADEGIRGSEADWVVLLNSDTIVTPGWLEGMLEAAASGEDVAMVGPVSNAATFQSIPELYDSRNQFKTNPLPAGWTPADMADLVAEVSDKAFPEAPLLNGFCTLMRRSVFLEVGGLNRAAFPTGYGEENDLCARVTKAGYRMVLADHVYVYHSKSASFGSTRRTELAKAGSKALKELHPDVDFGVLTARFREIPSLVRLRAAVRETYEEQI